MAELGSAFLAADLDLTPDVREDHAAYIGSWIKVLKDDKRAIFTAAAHAQRGVNFLHDLQPQPDVMPAWNPEDDNQPQPQEPVPA